MGLIGVLLKLIENFVTHRPTPHFPVTNPLYKDWFSVIMFALLAYSLFYFARKPVAGSEE